MHVTVENDTREANANFHHVVTFLSYVYLLRVPLVASVLMIALPPLALFSSLRSLLENLFVLDSWGIFWAMMIELTLAWSVLVVWRVVLLNGKERFGIDQWKKKDTVTWRSLSCASLPTLSLFVCACVEKREALPWISWRSWLLAAFGGALIAYVAGFLGLVISITLAPQYRTHPATDRFKIPFPFEWTILNWAENFRLIKLRNPNRFAEWARENLPADLRCGYLDKDGHLYPGHWLVLMLLVISSILYSVVGAFRGSRLGLLSNVPALSYVFIFMVVATFILSMLAFFLDRYRVPLLLPILISCLIGGQFPQSDHYFAFRDGVSITSVSPADALAIRSKANPETPEMQTLSGRAIVVATAGGGIQAAAWTVEVLSQLQNVCNAGKADGPNFGNSIAAISAVSGGAVGAMFYMNQYQTTGESPGFHPTSQQVQKALENAEAPSLGDVAWAMAYVDPYRVFFPYALNSSEEKTLDRGYVLEQTWRNRGSIYAYLSNWRDGVAQGYRPAIIFNSTIVETGQSFLMATTDFDIGTDIPRPRETFAHLFPNSDLPVVTATRLAASFPYVSPASRPLMSQPAFHIVDGGYYDNFGVDSMVAWLDQALTKIPQKKRPDVLFLQIRSFPYDDLPEPTNKGWLYQISAPIDALVNVRTTGQIARDDNELNFLVAKWGLLDNVHIDVASFDFRGPDAPLSWMMTENQKDTIRDYWKKQSDAYWKSGLGVPGFDIGKVRSFCSSGPPPVANAAEAH